MIAHHFRAYIHWSGLASVDDWMPNFSQAPAKIAFPMDDATKAQVNVAMDYFRRSAKEKKAGEYVATRFIAPCTGPITFRLGADGMLHLANRSPSFCQRQGL